MKFATRTIVASVAVLAMSLTACETMTTNAGSSAQVIEHSPSSVTAGFVTFDMENATWIFRDNSPELDKFAKGEELAKHSTKLVSTAQGVKVYKSDEVDTIKAYLALKPGFATRIVDQYLWVFADGSPELAVIDNGGELAKHVTQIASVGGKVQTVKAPDMDVLVDYKASMPGFVAMHHNGYLWVFHDDAEELDIIRSGGELAKHTTRITAEHGTIKAPDSETIAAYQAAKPGFVTRIVDGYLWVFADGSEELAVIKGGGELAKHVTRITSTPSGVMTIKSPDMQVVKAYLAR